MSYQYNQRAIVAATYPKFFLNAFKAIQPHETTRMVTEVLRCTTYLDATDAPEAMTREAYVAHAYHEIVKTMHEATGEALHPVLYSPKLDEAIEAALTAVNHESTSPSVEYVQASAKGNKLEMRFRLCYGWAQSHEEAESEWHEAPDANELLAKGLGTGCRAHKSRIVEGFGGGATYAWEVTYERELDLVGLLERALGETLKKHLAGEYDRSKR
jgi:hypothetical protein